MTPASSTIIDLQSGASERYWQRSEGCSPQPALAALTSAVRILTINPDQHRSGSLKEKRRQENMTPFYLTFSAKMTIAENERQSIELADHIQHSMDCLKR